MPVFRVEATITVNVTKYVKAPTKKAATEWADMQDWDASDGEQDDTADFDVTRDDEVEDYDVRIDRDGNELDD